MLKVVQLSKSFPKKKVLHSVSFEVPLQSIFGFVGVNGAGKSTLIKCFLKFLRPGDGQIFIRGRLIRDCPDYQKTIGYLPEVFQPPFDLKCREFLNYAHLLIHDRPLDRQAMETLLKRVGLFGNENQLIRKFSKGMRQRLGIAQALAHRPDLLILDEPFTGLDPIGRFELKELFKSVNREGTTIFFSSHNLSEIQDLCTHLAVLHDGTEKAKGDIASILESTGCRNLEEAYLKTVQQKRD
jgi:ABC-2 type transport system ATP-binding protein